MDSYTGLRLPTPTVDARLLEGVLAGAADGIIAIDKTGRIFLFNPAAGRIFGFTTDEMLGQDISVLLPAGLAERHRAHVAEFARSGSMRLMGERGRVKGRRKDGSTFPAEIGISRIDLDGLTLMVATVRDVEEREQLERRFMESSRLEAIGRLASGVAHDFANLLTVVLNSLPVIESDSRPGPEAMEALSDVEDAARRGITLTRHLLRRGSGEQGVQSEEIELHEALSEIVPLLRRLLRPEIELRTELPASPVWLRAAPYELDQLLINLVINAMDAMPEGGLILPRARETGNPAPGEGGRWVLLEVEDRGVGIDLTVQSRIFEPFFSTRGEGHSGLGLATVKAIMMRLGGKVSLRSAPGQGSCFSLLLPGIEPPRRSG